MNIVIIGSGLSGLSCAVVLAKNGHQVTVLEKEAVIGGCLQCFKRKGVKFETGMHFIGSASEGQTLNKYMRYLEIDDKVKLSPLDPEGYDVVCLDGKRYRFPNGREAFINQMSEYFPHQRENLQRYFDAIEEVSQASSLHSLKVSEGDSAINTEYHLRSVNDVINSIITDPLLQKVLVGNLPLYAGERDKTPFATHSFIMDFYNQSAYRIVGGSDTIATALQQTLERYGGRILTNSQATAINCEGKSATSVCVNGTSTIPADYVISSIHPQRTLDLLNTPLIRNVYRQRINSIPNTVSCFTIYVEFKDGAMPYMNHNFYGYHTDTPWDCEQYDQDSWPKSYLYMHLCHEDGAKFAKAGEIICYMWMDDVKQWAGTKPMQRGQEYEDFKLQKTRKVFQSIEKEFPGFQDTIKNYYTSTPLTYSDYTATVGGSMYGMAKHIDMGPAGRVHHRTKISNLCLSGQSINSHGMLGVLVGTIITCSELLTTQSLCQQIIEANK